MSEYNTASLTIAKNSDFQLSAFPELQLTTIIIIKVFLKCKLLSLETILSAHTHTHTHTHKGTHTHKHSDNTKLNIHSLKWAANARETWTE